MNREHLPAEDLVSSHDAAPTAPLAHLRLLEVGWVFLRIGAVAFGGLGAALALIQRELVERRRVLTAADVTEALTYTKLLPGSTVVQVVSYLGFRLHGWPGSALATVAFLVPSVLAMLGLAALYVSAESLPGIAPARNGLTAAVAGVLMATTVRIGKANIGDALTLTLALAAFGAVVFLGINAALIVIAAGAIGIVFLSGPPAAADGTGVGSR